MAIDPIDEMEDLWNDPRNIPDFLFDDEFDDDLDEIE